MKFLQIFNKTPNHKKFNFTTRFYDPQEEERQERERRIRQEMEAERANGNVSSQTQTEDEIYAHRQRIAGSFRTAKKTVTVQKDPSTSLLRLIIFTILTVGLIAYLHYGKEALYVIMLLIAPVYLYWRYKSLPKKNTQR